MAVGGCPTTGQARGPGRVEVTVRFTGGAQWTETLFALVHP